MPIFKPNQKTYAMDPMDAPLASVAQGEAFTLFTENALDAEEGYFNPLTGPIFVEGAKAGDTLAVDILEIRPHDGTAISRIHNGVGALSPTEDTPLLGAPPMERVYHYVQQGQDFVCQENERLRFAYQPFLGTLGTAPWYERISSVVPGPHGGNMDVKDVCPGHTVYLPVYTDGGKLYVGDAHACQGDGEFCGTALEMAAEVTLRCRVLPKKRIEGPRIETPTHLITVAAAKPLESAARMAYRALIDWMAADFGWDALDAYQAITQAGQMYLGQLVNPLYTMAAGVPKSLILGEKEK